MFPLRPSLSLILPFISGLCLLWALPQWKFLAQLEHRLFLFPERFEPGTFFPDRGLLQDLQVTPIRFSHESSPSTALGSYLIDEETLDIIDLSPEKWAYFLQVIRKNSEGLIAITAPLSWTHASELALQTLEHQISETPQLVIGLDAEFNNTSAPLPPFLENSTLPIHHSLFPQLPEIDFITHPPSIKAPLFGISTIQGFVIERDGSELKIPMLVRWGDAILPSTHLAALLTSAQITVQELIVDPSGYLRLGHEGPILKIDPQGRAAFPRTGNNTRSASQILISPEETSPSKILLPANAPEELRLLQTHLTRALAQKPQNLSPYTRWPLALEITLLLLFTLLLQARRLWLTLLSIAALLLISTTLHQWFPSSPLALTLITFTILPRPSLRRSPPHKKEKPLPPSEKPQPSPKKAAKKIPKKSARKKSRKHTRPKKKKRR